jgi:hypothetical protein
LLAANITSPERPQWVESGHKTDRFSAFLFGIPVLGSPHGGIANPLFDPGCASALKFTENAPHRVTLVNLSARIERRALQERPAMD